MKIDAPYDYNPIENAIDSVEAFNGLTLDKSKDMFKSCLGTEFPFDVLEAVDGYANKLKDILNANLDALICGNAGFDLLNATKSTFVDTFNSTVGAYESLTGDSVGKAELTTVETVTKNPDGTTNTSVNTVVSIKQSNDLQEVTRLNNIATDYTWLTTHSLYDKTKGVKDLGTKVVGNNIVREWHKQYQSIMGYKEKDLGAEAVYVAFKVTSDKNGAVKPQNIGTFIVEFELEVSVAITNLYRGPYENQGQPDVLPAVPEGHFIKKWKYKKELESFPQSIQLDAVDVPFENHPDITLKISPVLQDFNIADKGNVLPPNFYIGLSQLRFKNEWSKYSSYLTAEQQADLEAAKASSNKLKTMAMNSLKSQFMSSSVINEVLYDQIEDLSKICPMLSNVDIQNINDTIKDTIATNAIALANGDDLRIDMTMVNSIASELTSSSINYGLEKLGIDKFVSSDCTKELLEGLTFMIPDFTLSNPFGGLSSFIDFSDAIAFAKGVVSKMMDMFNSLMSADCMVAINNSFDICSHDLAVATGNTLRFASESLNDPTLAYDSAKEFV